jgi:hypothetical protein
MQKTVVVAVSYVVWIPKYKVYQKRVSRHKVRGLDRVVVCRGYGRELGLVTAEPTPDQRLATGRASPHRPAHAKT